MIKKIKSVKEAQYGFKTYWVVVYTDNSCEIKYYLTKEMESFL